MVGVGAGVALKVKDRYAAQLFELVSLPLFPTPNAEKPAAWIPPQAEIWEELMCLFWNRAAQNNVLYVVVLGTSGCSWVPPHPYREYPSVQVCRGVVPENDFLKTAPQLRQPAVGPRILHPVLYGCPWLLGLGRAAEDTGTWQAVYVIKLHQQGENIGKSHCIVCFKI